MHSKNGKKLEALELLQAMLPEAKQFFPPIYSPAVMLLVDVLFDLGRYHEAHEMVADLVPYSKAKFGLEDPKTLVAMHAYATACATLGRVDEAKATFEDILTIETRVFGPEHRYTQNTQKSLRLM